MGCLVGSLAVELFLHPSGETRCRKIEDAVSCGAYIVPVGYVSDGGSIPRFAWPIVGHPFSADLLRACLIHDIRCEFHVGTPSDTHRQLRILLDEEGVSWWRRWLIYLAVRARGPRWTDGISLETLHEIIRGRTWGEYHR